MKKFSIILPVRNGGHYVKDCVNSILLQTYPEFELLILDNKSTDGTSEWIATLKDQRIKLYPSQRSLSIEDNWSRITSVPKNEFMTMIGHDDLLEPNYLEVMNDLIERHPTATLYQTHFNYIDSNGELIRHCKPMDEIQSAEEFLAFFFNSMIDVMGSGFMMRSSDYDALGGIPPRYPNLLFADFELLINLTLGKYKATSVQECFSFRLHQSMTTTSSDIKFHKAYQIFIDYLETLKQQQRFKNIIERYALDFIRYYTKGLSHRLLRSPKSKREGMSVKKFLDESKRQADRLVPGNNFDPKREFSVRIASKIDGNIFLSYIFRGFKKFYSKPVYS